MVEDNYTLENQITDLWKYQWVQEAAAAVSFNTRGICSIDIV